MTTVKFQEEFSAKIPALALLANLGYTFITPNESEVLRGNQFLGDKKSTHQVVLLPIMRDFLAKQTFPFAGKQHALSDAAIDKIMHELNPAMNLGLKAANEKLYNALLYGVSGVFLASCPVFYAAIFRFFSVFTCSFSGFSSTVSQWFQLRVFRPFQRCGLASRAYSYTALRLLSIATSRPL